MKHLTKLLLIMFVGLLAVMFVMAASTSRPAEDVKPKDEGGEAAATNVFANAEKPTAAELIEKIKGGLKGDDVLKALKTLHDAAPAQYKIAMADPVVKFDSKEILELAKEEIAKFPEGTPQSEDDKKILAKYLIALGETGEGPKFPELSEDGKNLPAGIKFVDDTLIIGDLKLELKGDNLKNLKGAEIRFPTGTLMQINNPQGPVSFEHLKGKYTLEGKGSEFELCETKNKELEIDVDVKKGAEVARVTTPDPNFPAIEIGYPPGFGKNSEYGGSARLFFKENKFSNNILSSGKGVRVELNQPNKVQLEKSYILFGYEEKEGKMIPSQEVGNFIVGENVAKIEVSKYIYHVEGTHPGGRQILNFGGDNAVLLLGNGNDVIARAYSGKNSGVDMNEKIIPGQVPGGINRVMTEGIMLIIDDPAAIKASAGETAKQIAVAYPDNIAGLRGLKFFGKEVDYAVVKTEKWGQDRHIPFSGKGIFTNCYGDTGTCMEVNAGQIKAKEGGKAAYIDMQLGEKGLKINQGVNVAEATSFMKLDRFKTVKEGAQKYSTIIGFDKDGNPQFAYEDNPEIVKDHNGVILDEFTIEVVGKDGDKEILLARQVSKNNKDKGTNAQYLLEKDEKGLKVKSIIINGVEVKDHELAEYNSENIEALITEMLAKGETLTKDEIDNLAKEGAAVDADSGFPDWATGAKDTAERKNGAEDDRFVFYTLVNDKGESICPPCESLRRRLGNDVPYTEVKVVQDSPLYKEIYEKRGHTFPYTRIDGIDRSGAKIDDAVDALQASRAELARATPEPVKPPAVDKPVDKPAEPENPHADLFEKIGAPADTKLPLSTGLHYAKALKEKDIDPNVVLKKLPAGYQWKWNNAKGSWVPTKT